MFDMETTFGHLAQNAYSVKNFIDHPAMFGLMSDFLGSFKSLSNVLFQFLGHLKDESSEK